MKQRYLILCLSFLWSILIPLPGIARHKISDIHRNHKKTIKFKQLTGIIQEINNRRLWLYELKNNRDIYYNIARKCIIINKNSSVIKNGFSTYDLSSLKNGYMVKILVDPITNSIKKIYIEELPQ